MAASSSNRILDDWAAAWSSRDPEKVLSLLTDDCVFEDSTFAVINRGRSEVRSFVEYLFAGIPDYTIELRNGFVTEDRATAEWTVSGTHRGDFPGMPATGKRFTGRGCSVFELKGGRIRRQCDYWDASALMRQVGLLPPLE